MLSAVIITLNEAANIAACLKTLSWCDEIILVDNGSQDDTIRLAQKTIAADRLRVFRVSRRGDLAALRNFGQRHATNPWVLALDADHRVSPRLRREILTVINNPSTPFVGYRLRQVDSFLGRRLLHGETGSNYRLLLVRQPAGSWHRRVHEVCRCRGPVGVLQQPLLHYPHPTISQFIDHINRWSDLDAREFLGPGRQTFSYWKLFCFPLGKFVVNYFLRLGFLDGFPGFTLAVVMSCHSFLVRLKMKEFELVS